jgi:AbrB family looped-hinge helix DNA binding protein
MVKFHGPKVYGTVTVGERGQIVIPVEVRKSYRIKSGDRLIVVAKLDAGPISLIPADQLNKFLNHMTEMLTEIKKVRAK